MAEGNAGVAGVKEGNNMLPIFISIGALVIGIIALLSSRR
jgi:hypothetical protein